MVKVLGIIQARLSSSRLPAKVMLNLAGKTVLERVVERVKLSNQINEICVATSNETEDSLIENIALQIGQRCVRGSLTNVFDRFYQVIKDSDAEIVVRITSDNPLTEPKLIDKGISYIIENDVDYVGFKNVPVGSAVEVFTRKSYLKIADEGDLTAHNKEHVTSYYYQHPEKFSVVFLDDNNYTKEQASLSVTVDTLDDYYKIAMLFNDLEKNNTDPSEFLDKALTCYLHTPLC